LTSANGISITYDQNGLIADSNGLAIVRDAGGRLDRITLAPGKTVTYSYDSRNLLTRVTDWLGDAATFTYDDAGRLTAVNRSNGVTTTYTYDADDRVIGIAEGSLADISLTRDAKGQITSAGRNVPLEPAFTESSMSLSFDGASQVDSYAYDAMGRLTNDGVRTYTWDHASRITSYTVGANTVTFTSDALGYRLSRTQGGVTRSFVWNYALGLPSISVVREGGSDLRYYVHSPGGHLLFSIEASDDSRRFYHYDEMGNTLFLTDAGGAVIGSYAYSPYGMQLGSTGVLDNPFTWQGRFGVMNEGGVLYYMRARYYHSATGRFISRDPVKSLHPKELNPYQYALGNPMRYIDPGGLFINLHRIGWEIRTQLVDRLSLYKFWLHSRIYHAWKISQSKYKWSYPMKNMFDLYRQGIEVDYRGELPNIVDSNSILSGNYFLEGVLGGDHEIRFGVDYYYAIKDFSTTPIPTTYYAVKDFSIPIPTTYYRVGGGSYHDAWVQKGQVDSVVDKPAGKSPSRGDRWEREPYVSYADSLTPEQWFISAIFFVYPGD